MNKILQGISHIVAPRVCRICGQTLTADEEVMCLECFVNLPRANVHKSDFNAIHQRLGHKAPVVKAGAWYMYKKGNPYAQMLIDAKYGNLPKLAALMGEMCAKELSGDGFFDGIDAIVPMPMYWAKRISRGYNQAFEIAKGISSVAKLPICEALKANKSHGVQSRNSKAERYLSIEGTLSLKRNADVAGKSLLFVDDIITTGASAAAAVKTLCESPPASVSVLCIGLTY